MTLLFTSVRSLSSGRRITSRARNFTQRSRMAREQFSQTSLWTRVITSMLLQETRSTCSIATASDSKALTTRSTITWWSILDFITQTSLIRYYRRNLLFRGRDTRPLSENLTMTSRATLTRTRCCQRSLQRVHLVVIGRTRPHHTGRVALMYTNLWSHGIKATSDLGKFSSIISIRLTRGISKHRRRNLEPRRRWVDRTSCSLRRRI